MFMMSCSCSARPVFRSNACVIEPSDSVIAVLGDSVCNVIFHAPEVPQMPVSRGNNRRS